MLTNIQVGAFLGCTGSLFPGITRGLPALNKHPILACIAGASIGAAGGISVIPLSTWPAAFVGLYYTIIGGWVSNLIDAA